MTTRRGLLAYLATVLLLGGVGGPALHFGLWASRVVPCRDLQRPGAYLAYCDNPDFGSYEHAAYRFGFEGEAVAAMTAAPVLFLGNSRLQHGFSTAATDRFFAARDVAYHLLGFGYGESSRFPADLIRRHRPAPKLVVINADPFFQRIYSPVAYDMWLKPTAAWFDGLSKRLFDRLRPAFCALGLCTGRDPAVYRDRRTGQWIWQGVLVPGDRAADPVVDSKRESWSPDALPAWLAEARSVLALLPTPPACILLTGVPTPAVDAEGMARALGAALDLPVVQPAATGLVTFDGSHLNGPSAERWSAAFLEAAAPRIDACLSAHPP